MGKVKITETSLRDGHQSLMATRMTTAEMLPIIETMDKIGYHAMEVWWCNLRCSNQIFARRSLGKIERN